MSDKRLHYIDWLRVLAVLLLFPFHAGRVFNLGEPFYAKSPIGSVELSYLLGFIDAWHMPLLFFLAGASTCLALRRRTTGQYVGERTLRLLVPLVFGVFVLVPPQTWLGSLTNAGARWSFGEYLASGAFLDTGNLFGRGDYFGGVSPAHLWFILFLWIISIMVLPALVFGMTPRGDAFFARAARTLSRPWAWTIAAFLILVAEALPDIAGKNIFIYATFFLLGYTVMHDEAFAEAAVRFRAPALAAGLSIAALGVAFWRSEQAMPDPSWPRTVWTYAQDLGAWLAVIGFTGFGRALLDRPSKPLAYLAEASYPLYILHQTVIVAIGFPLVRVLPSWYLGWPVLIGLSVSVTFGLYEIVRRLSPLRFAFGMKPARA